jgi:hypothetical protein
VCWVGFTFYDIIVVSYSLLSSSYRHVMDDVAIVHRKGCGFSNSLFPTLYVVDATIWSSESSNLEGTTSANIRVVE